MGYYGVYVGLKIQANHELKARLDADAYTEEETITVKIPLSVPYHTGSGKFHRINGDFEKDGKSYNLVKQKLERDTLHVVYIRDHKEAALSEMLADFVQNATDTPIQKKAGKLIENFVKDYLSITNEIQTASAGWSLTETLPQPGFLVASASVKVHLPPPKATA
ncbi:MAG: hypothetical protein WDN75_19045 [Bacteroidota bacterium]